MGIRTTILQGTPEWYLARNGMINSSEVTPGFARNQSTPKDAMSFGKGAKSYVIGVAGDRMGGMDEDTYQSPLMLRGSTLEDEALDRYEDRMFTTLDRGTWWVHDNMNIACSPDGLDEESPDGKGGVEVKCQNRAKHAMCWIAQEVPPEHKYQVNINLWITGYDYWDYISYHPGVREDLQLCIIRTLPNHQFFTEISMRMIELERQINNATHDLGILDWKPYWKSLGPAAIFQSGGQLVQPAATFPVPGDDVIADDVQAETARFLARFKELQRTAERFARG